MIANRYLNFKNYNISINKYNPVLGRAVFSLQNIKKVTYEPNNKTLNLYYFAEPLPETICNVEESTYQEVVTALCQPTTHGNFSP